MSIRGFFRKSKKGFTLVELIVVIAIMAIVATIVFPNMKGVLKNAELRKNKSYCIGAATYVGSYVNLMNLGDDDNVYYENDKNEICAANIKTSTGLQVALNYYNLESAYQYYVLDYSNAQLAVNPSPTIKSLMNTEKLQSTKDVMIVAITDESGYYRLKGFWYYSVEEGGVVCTYKAVTKAGTKGFTALNS